MLYKYDKHTCDFLGRFYFYLSQNYFLEFRGILNKTVIPVALVGFESATHLVDYVPSYI